MPDQYIYHYGIKGMRWGVRRTPAQLGHKKKRSLRETAGAVKKKLSKSSSADSESARKSVRDMSDDELRRALSRLDMEKRYKQCMAELHPRKKSRAVKVVADIMENGAKTLASKAFERLAKSIFEKNKPADKVTNIDFEDISKAGDKALKEALQRLNTEQAYRKALGEVKEARGAEKAVQDWLERKEKEKKGG